MNKTWKVAEHWRKAYDPKTKQDTFVLVKAHMKGTPHDCGMCDAPLVFDGWQEEYATWRCTSCDWWHISKDCCE